MNNRLYDLYVHRYFEIRYRYAAFGPRYLHEIERELSRLPEDVRCVTAIVLADAAQDRPVRSRADVESLFTAMAERQLAA
jgi:hypothetical protein